MFRVHIAILFLFICLWILCTKQVDYIQEKENYISHWKAIKEGEGKHNL